MWWVDRLNPGYLAQMLCLFLLVSLSVLAGIGFATLLRWLAWWVW